MLYCNVYIYIYIIYSISYIYIYMWFSQTLCFSQTWKTWNLPLLIGKHRKTICKWLMFNIHIMSMFVYQMVYQGYKKIHRPHPGDVSTLRNHRLWKGRLMNHGSHPHPPYSQNIFHFAASERGYFSNCRSAPFLGSPGRCSPPWAFPPCFPRCDCDRRWMAPLKAAA